MSNSEAKFGRLTPDSWGTAMPAHNSSFKKGPWYYRDTEAVMITYLTDEDMALDLLPSDLKLIEPACAFMVIEFNHFTTSGGPYGEVYTGVLCEYEGQTYAYCNGVYVTTENALVPGREVWGFGKKLAHRIELIRQGTGEIEAVVEVKPGHIDARAIAHPHINLSADVLEEMPLCVLKIIPGVEGGEPDVAKLNTVSFGGPPHKGPDGKDELYACEATLEVGKYSDINLPVLQVLDTKYIRMTADLPYGKTLIDYKTK